MPRIQTLEGLQPIDEQYSKALSIVISQAQTNEQLLAGIDVGHSPATSTLLEKVFGTSKIVTINPQVLSKLRDTFRASDETAQQKSLLKYHPEVRGLFTGAWSTFEQGTAAAEHKKSAQIRQLKRQAGKEHTIGNEEQLNEIDVLQSMDPCVPLSVVVAARQAMSSLHEGLTALYNGVGVLREQDEERRKQEQFNAELAKRLQEVTDLLAEVQQKAVQTSWDELYRAGAQTMSKMIDLAIFAADALPKPVRKLFTRFSAIIEKKDYKQCARITGELIGILRKEQWEVTEQKAKAKALVLNAMVISLDTLKAVNEFFKASATAIASGEAAPTLCLPAVPALPELVPVPEELRTPPALIQAPEKQLPG